MRRSRTQKAFIYAIVVAVCLTFIGSSAEAYTLTPRLSLKKPVSGSEPGWGPMLNGNSDTLDDAVLEGSPGVNGQLAYYTSATRIAPTGYSLGAVALLTAAQTLTNKVIDSADNTLKIAGTTVTGKSGDTGVLVTGASPFTSGNLVQFDANGNAADSGISAVGAAAAPFSDGVALVKASGDSTKKGRFNVSGFAAGHDYTFILPDVDGDTVTLLAAAQTLLAKTFDTALNTFKINGQTISSVSGNTTKVATVSGSPTSQRLLKIDANGNVADAGIILDAVSGNTTTAATVDGTLTPGNALTTDLDGNIVDGGAGSGAPFDDSLTLLSNNLDPTKLARFSLSGLSTGVTRVYTLQDRNGTLADMGANVFTDHQTIDNQKEIRFRELTSNGTNYTGWRAPASLAGNLMYDMPSVDGADGDVLTTHADGTTEWLTPSGGLEVKEFDGTPDLTGSTLIQVPNGSLIDNGGGSIALEYEFCDISTSLPGTCSVGDCVHIRNATNGIPSNTYFCYATNSWATAASQVMANGSGSSSLDNSTDSFFPITGIGYNTASAVNVYTGLRDVIISDLYCAADGNEASPSNGHTIRVCDSVGGCSSLACGLTDTTSCTDTTHRLSWSGLRGAYMRSEIVGTPTVAIKAYCQVKVNTVTP